MASPRFVHLRIHSEFSITDGVVRIDDAVASLEYNEYVDSPLQALEVLKGDTND